MDESPTISLTLNMALRGAFRDRVSFRGEVFWAGEQTEVCLVPLEAGLGFHRAPRMLLTVHPVPTD